MEKDVFERYPYPETYTGASRGKIVLHFLADMFAANMYINHPAYSDQRNYTSDTLWSVLRFATSDTRTKLFNKLIHNRDLTEKVDAVVNAFIMIKLGKLEEIFYQGIPLTQEELRLTNPNLEESRLARLVIEVIEFDGELKEHIRMLYTPRPLPQRRR